MTPEAIAALDKLAQTLNGMNLPALITIGFVIFFLVPTVVSIILGRVAMAYLSATRESINAAHGQVTDSLTLAGQSAHNVKMLSQVIDENHELTRKTTEAQHTTTRQTVEAAMSEIRQEVEATRDAILAKLANVRGTLGEVGEQIKEGFDKATLTTESIQEGVTRLEEGLQSLVAGMDRLLAFVEKHDQKDETVLAQIETMAGRIGALSEDITALRSKLENDDPKPIE